MLKINGTTANSIEPVKSNSTWLFKIGNFSKYNETNQAITSPQFILSGGNVCSILLYPHGDTSNNNREYISLYIQSPPAKNPIEVNSKLSIVSGFNFKMSIISADSKEQFKLQTCHPGKTYSWGWHKFVERAKLFARKDYFLPNDVLTISCEISISSCIFPSVKIQIPESQHVENLQRLVEHKKLGDIITLRICNKSALITSNQQESTSTPSFISTRSLEKENTVKPRDFQVYKEILMSKSLVFRAMFNHKKTNENQENLVKIEDMDPEVCDDMLHFLHQDELRASDDNLMKLLAAADKYEISRLKALCEEALFKILTKENSLITLGSADLYNASQLKKATIDFIVEHIDDMKKSDEYKSFERKNPALALEIFKNAYEKKNSNTK